MTIDDPSSDAATTSSSEAAELSHTRLICYRNRSLWGLGGETLACQAGMGLGWFAMESQHICR
jgi:hypothetical protein